MFDLFHLLCVGGSEEIEWMRSLPYTISIPSFQCLVVHAGIVPNIPIEKQKKSDMTKMRNLIASHSRSRGGCDEQEEQQFEAVEKSDEGGIAWAEEWGGPEHIYFGHDAKRGLQNHSFATGLDTGCCYGNSLIVILFVVDFLNRSKTFCDNSSRKYFDSSRCSYSSCDSREGRKLVSEVRLFD